MSFLSIKGLNYTYPGEDKPALASVDLEVKEGELLALVGPNAAGKSTIARAIKGLLVPDSGKILIGSRSVSSQIPDQRVGFLQSNPENQLVTSIVEEDIAFGLETLGMDPAAIKSGVDRTLSRLDLERFRRAMPHRLSCGEQQMVALAGALAPDPEILVLDEPTAYLDPMGRAAVMKALKSLSDMGRTIILITHDMEEASHADRVALVNEGIVEDVSPPALFFRDSSILQTGRLKQPFAVRLADALEDRGVDLPSCSPRLDLFLSTLKGMAANLPPERGGVKHQTPDPVSENVPMALTFRDVVYRYTSGMGENTDILKGINLDVPEGRMSLLCGANGAGKSTLLQMSNGLLSPDSGEVLLNGMRLNALDKQPGGIPAHVALLFQNPERQIFSETVFDDVAFGPRNLGVDEGRVSRSVLEAIQWVGLDTDVLSRSPFKLSGGQMRRVAVAGVIAMDPKVLILDEPTDGLDPYGADEFMSRAQQYIEKTGATILMATHRVPESITDRCRLAVLSSGSICANGEPLDVLLAPDQPLSMDFMPPHIWAQIRLMKDGLAHQPVSLDPDRAVEFIVGSVTR
ncbi:ATP-binding cassette domain-containing protein [bacterium]|nr:MAG: ATP-binding cassette domain-containing protein [bacterium]